MAVLVIPNLGPTRETFWTQVEVNTDSTRDPQSVDELRTVVTIIPGKNRLLKTRISSKMKNAVLLCKYLSYSGIFWFLGRHDVICLSIN